jgi:hypothetical protein
MSGYNPNYFDRKLVNSMKNAISQIVVKEQFPGTAEGQPGLGLGQISDLELQKRMRNKKNTSIFNKNPKQSKEYLELEAEANRRAAATSQTQTPAQTQAPAPTTTTTPSSTGGGKSLFAPDTQKSSVGIPDLLRRPPEETSGSGRKPGQVTTQRSAIPTQQEIQKTQTTADTTGIPTALPTNVTPGTVGMTDMDGNPIVLQPTKPRSISAPKPNLMSNVPGKSYRDRFSMGIGNITVPNAQLQSFKQAKETAYGQNVSRRGAYSPNDTASMQRGNEADTAAGDISLPGLGVGAGVGGVIGGSIGALFGGIGAIPGAAIGTALGGMFGGEIGKDLPKTKPSKPTKVQGPAASQQELQAAQNAAPAPANFTSNYAARVAAARARAKR